MVTLIRWIGWFGIGINLYAIITRNIEIFLIGQLVASLSSFLYSKWLQKKLTIDIVLSLVLTSIAVITKDTYVMYMAILTRSVSYQLQFERVLEARLNHK